MPMRSCQFNDEPIEYLLSDTDANGTETYDAATAGSTGVATIEAKGEDTGATREAEVIGDVIILYEVTSGLAVTEAASTKTVIC
ncbi:unnamed protein product, partial [Iphiclides podalirius]